MPDPHDDFDLEEDAQPRQALPKSTIVSLVVVLLLGVGFLAGILVLGKQKPEPPPPEEEDVDPTEMEGSLLSASGSIIGDLLKRGERALKQGRWVEPPGANVLDFVKEIDKLAPGNSLAKDLARRTYAAIKATADAAYAAQDWPRAARFYRQLVRFAPSDLWASDRLAEVDKLAKGAPPPPPGPPAPPGG